jgi:hypothetical protein
MFAVLLTGILQGVEPPESVSSILPQWWHLMLSQYVAASFHLPSVSTANINTVQYTKPHKQYEIPIIPAVVKSNVLLPQYIMAATAHSLSTLSTNVSPGLPKYSNHVTQYTVLFIVHCCCAPQAPAQTVQLPTHSSTYNLTIAHRNVLITLCNWVTNYEYWFVAEQNARQERRSPVKVADVVGLWEFNIYWSDANTNI